MLRKTKLIKVYQYNSFEKTEDEIFEMFEKDEHYSEWSEYIITYDFENKVYLVHKIIH